MNQIMTVKVRVRTGKGTALYKTCQHLRAKGSSMIEHIIACVTMQSQHNAKARGSC